MRSASLTGLALLFLSAAAVALSARLPKPVPATASPSEFSAERAMEHVRAIAQRPRPSGSAEHARVRQYLIDTLAVLGLETQIQEATGVGTHNTVAARVVNVLARVAGRNAGGPAVLLAAHYDGVAAGPGAGDDAAGVAALLETLRALRADPPLAHDVIALFSDGEEAGLTGAAAFTREHDWARRVAMILNFEGRGTAGPSAMFETGAGNLDAVGVLRQIRDATASSLSVTVYRRLPNDTDVSELVALGQPALNFGFADGLERYHSASDDVAHLVVGSVQHHGGQALALARAFGESPLPRPHTGDAVFFAIPGVGLIVYPARFVMPITLVAVVLVLGSVLRISRRDPHWLRAATLGITGTIMSGALAAALAYGVMSLVDQLIGSPTTGGSAAGRGFFAVSIVVLTLAAVFATSAVIRQRTDVGARIGPLLVWTAVVVIVTARLPGTSYLFVWPLLAAACAALVALATERSGFRHLADWATTLVTVFLVVPAVRSVAVVTLGMSDLGAMIIALFTSMSAWLLAPQVDTLAAGRRWIAAAIAMAGAFGLIGIAAVRAEPSAAHPEPSMLGYAFDNETSRTWWVAPPALTRRGSWAAGVLGSAARLVIPGARTGPDDPPEWLTRALAGESRTLAAAAPSVPVQLPEIVVAGDSALGDTRQIELCIRPAPGTYSIRLRALDAPVLSATVDGRVIDRTRYRTMPAQWTLGYVAPSPDGFSLSLIVPRDRPVEFEVVARSLGLPMHSNITIPSRPPHVTPINSGDQTIAYRRIRL